MRAILFVNGILDEPRTFAARIAADDLLIAVDGGARHLLAMGRLPGLLVGDLDSVEPALVEAWARDGVLIQRHPEMKDQTDLELAIECALSAGAAEIWLAGALGGRMDHTLANLLILAQREWPVPLYIVDGMQVARLLRGPADAWINGAPGDLLSAIPLSERVTGISYEGLAYPLTDATLALGSTRGVSNVFVEGRARVRLGSGLVLVITTALQEGRG